MSQYSAPNYYMAPNPLATWALVLGIIALVLSPFVVGGLVGIAAVIVGILAARHQQGKGLAIGGIVMGAFAIVVAVLAGLIAFAIFRAGSRVMAMGAPPIVATQQIIAYEVALDDFETDCGRLPTTAEGFAALEKPPADVAAKWHGPYLHGLPDDPWGRPYEYLSPGPAGGDTYLITSNGPDGVAGTRDDITRGGGHP